MKKLYRFDAYFGRMGSLRGTFVADEKAVEAAIGRRVYFGEALGKHSEIWIDALKPEHVRPLTDDAAFVAKFEEYGCGSGYNPLSYITCPECGEPLESPYIECACGWGSARE